MYERLDEAVREIKRLHRPFGLVGMPGDATCNILLLHQCNKDGSATGPPLAVVGRGDAAAALARELGRQRHD